ncbi:MAG: mutase-like protein, partial [Bacteroidetes bacterium]|nr:mutase-like protein [Bacteroidota bacterium]
MDSSQLTRLLNDLRSGKRSVREVARLLAAPPAESIAFATIDHHRGIRQGFPEVIFCEG